VQINLHFVMLEVQALDNFTLQIVLVYKSVHRMVFILISFSALIFYGNEILKNYSPV
jgi:hypothetical protein